MTSLISWVGVDTHGTASIYLASDSRISWGVNQVWDCGRKLFASINHPIILGYYGDVLFPSQVLGQITDLIDYELLFEPTDSVETKFTKISLLLQDSFVNYPKEQSRAFEVVCCFRENEGMKSEFHIAILAWKPNIGWASNWLELPKKSGVIRVFGSGEKSVKVWYDRWSNTKEKGTSRTVFSAFCDALNSGEDNFTGGAPQLVGIYRIGKGKTFGVIYKNQRYLYGLSMMDGYKLSGIEWRNCLFERCDWESLRRLENAQVHKRPKGLGKG